MKPKYNDIYDYIVANANKRVDYCDYDTWPKEFNDRLIDIAIINLKEESQPSMCSCIKQAWFDCTNNKFSFPIDFFQHLNPKFTREYYKEITNSNTCDDICPFWDIRTPKGTERRIKFLTWLKEQYEENN